jgi:hypothetical protein
MQLTNLQVLNALQALNVLGQEKLPIKLAWKVTTAIRSLEPFAKAVDEPMKTIRTKHAIQDEEGNFIPAVDSDGNSIPDTVQIPRDKLEAVNKEMDELLNQTIEVQNASLKLSDFPESTQLSPAILHALTPLIKDDIPAELSLVK